MKRICTVCARAGSKGVRGKNLRILNGLPLLAHSLRQAALSGLFDVIAVSSDSPEMLIIAKEHGANVLVDRPAEMATDTAAKLPVIRHCVAEAERTVGVTFDTCVDLDATSPLRDIDDIRAVVQMIESSGAGNVITAMPARRSPYFNMVEQDERGLVRLAKSTTPPVVRRQDAPACFDMNASIYGWKREVLMTAPGLFNHDTHLHVMPEDRSIDIDSEVDFLLVELLMSRNAHGTKAGTKEGKS
jgi:N-acylneuraminate cytidylyltransferase/CMP-N,N'-diacetyllegionaminic acid synthase